jgi:hypothetical protein
MMVRDTIADRNTHRLLFQPTFTDKVFNKIRKTIGR